LAAADQLAQEQLKARIPQALGRLKLESHRERFERLVAKVEGRFGTGVIDKGMPSDLIAALRDFRGKVAHGHYEPKDETEYQRFIKSIFAVETLCFLLTCFDLPMTNEGVGRMKNSTLVEQYRHFRIE
jgi:hypothetical protein